MKTAFPILKLHRDPVLVVMAVVAVVMAVVLGLVRLAHFQRLRVGLVMGVTLAVTLLVGVTVVLVEVVLVQQVVTI